MLPYVNKLVLLTSKKMDRRKNESAMTQPRKEESIDLACRGRDTLITRTDTCLVIFFFHHKIRRPSLLCLQAAFPWRSRSIPNIFKKRPESRQIAIRTRRRTKTPTEVSAGVGTIYLLGTFGLQVRKWFLSGTLFERSRLCLFNPQNQQHHIFHISIFIWSWQRRGRCSIRTQSMNST